MQPSIKRWFRNLLLSSIYTLGVFGILASGDGVNDVVSDFTCGLSIRGIAPVGDGTVWVGVFAKTNTNTEDRVVRLDVDGSELASYFIGDGGSENAVRAVALDALGNVYVGGEFSGGILRLDDDGALDMDFVVGSGFNNKVTSITPAADVSGNIYVGVDGSFPTYKGNLISGLVRLTSAGALDNNFSAVISDVDAIAMAADGTFDLFSGGRFQPLIERWDMFGNRDTNFNPTIGPVFSIAPIPVAMGDIYVGGRFTTGIIRLNSNGTTDMGFIVNGGFNADVLSIARAADMTGDIYVGGSFTTYKGIAASGILRLDDNGSRDNGFDIGGGFEDPNNLFPFSKVASVALDGTSGVYVGGGFTQYKGTASNGIVRLDTVGALDTTFNVSITIDGEVCNSQTIPDS